MIEEEQNLDSEVEFIDEGEENDSISKISSLKKKISELQKEKTEYLDGWQRARADYANLQKSFEEDKKRLKEVFKENFISDLIPVVDSFQMAMNNKQAWESVDLNWRQGVEYIYNQLISTLENQGLKIFGEVGEVFDPAKYEAVKEEETDDISKDHKISKIIQKGFMLRDIVIRPARVVVFLANKQ